MPRGSTSFDVVVDLHAGAFNDEAADNVDVIRCGN